MKRDTDDTYDVNIIIQGYAQGYFLMADEYNQLRWYRSKEHTLIPLDERFRYPRSLQKGSQSTEIHSQNQPGFYGSS